MKTISQKNIRQFAVCVFAIIGFMSLSACGEPVAVDKNGNVIKGGMRITVELSPADMLREMAGNRMDSILEQAICQADTGDNFFYQFENAVDSTIQLWTYFNNAVNVDRNTDNHSVCSMLANEWDPYWSAESLAGEVIDWKEKKMLGVRDQALLTIQRRLAKIQGTGNASEPHRIGNSRKYYFDILKVKDSKRIERLVTAPGKFELWLLEDEKTAVRQLRSIDSCFHHKLFVLLREGDHIGAVGQASPEDADAIDTSLAEAAGQRLFNPRFLKFLWSRGRNRLYAIRVTSRDGSPLMDGSAIEKAKGGMDDIGHAAVDIAFTSEGARAWREKTWENIGRAVAFVVDDRVYSTPTIMSEIAGGWAQISGIGTDEEAEDLAAILSSPPLKCKVNIVEMLVGKDVLDPEK